VFINVSAFDRYVTSSFVVAGSLVSFVLIDAITISGNGRTKAGLTDQPGGPTENADEAGLVDAVRGYIFVLCLTLSGFVASRPLMESQSTT
jgi:hypothetical protein